MPILPFTNSSDKWNYVLHVKYMFVWTNKTLLAADSVVSLKNQTKGQCDKIISNVIHVSLAFYFIIYLTRALKVCNLFFLSQSRYSLLVKMVLWYDSLQSTTSPNMPALRTCLVAFAVDVERHADHFICPEPQRRTNDHLANDRTDWNIVPAPGLLGRWARQRSMVHHRATENPDSKQNQDSVGSWWTWKGVVVALHTLLARFGMTTCRPRERTSWKLFSQVLVFFGISNYNNYNWHKTTANASMLLSVIVNSLC